MIFLYSIVLILFSIYSYSLVDVNLTLINNRYWEWFRNIMVSFGYFHRDLSAVSYLVFIILFFIFYLYFVKNYQKVPVLKFSLLIGLIVIFSYPFLSHDFFNYIFDAKILTFYHKNPYLHRALDFPDDPWLRFLHWTHRRYPYGPAFLILSLPASFLSFGKFILNFLLFKLTVVFFYLLPIFYLSKMNKKWAVIFAFHPLIIIEGLINGHNDILALSLGIIGVFFLNRNKNWWARMLFLLSIGIKYITAPIIALTKNRKMQNHFIFFAQIGVILYLSFTLEIQPWYFLSLFIFLPYYEVLLSRFNLFFVGLLFSYYPYIRLGGWNSPENINIKHQIIIFFAAINLLYLLFIYFKRFKRKFLIR